MFALTKFSQYSLTMVYTVVSGHGGLKIVEENNHV